MAGIGLRHPYAAVREYDKTTGTAAYSGGMEIGALIQADISIEKTDAAILYGNDAAKESIPPTFKSGTITLNTTDLSPEVSKFLFGLTSEKLTINGEEVEELGYGESDIAATIGLGHIVPELVDNVRLFRAIFYPKVQFSVPNDSFKTKGDSFEWQTPTIEGLIVSPEEGKWKYEVEVKSLQTAIAWLKQKLSLSDGIVPQAMAATVRAVAAKTSTDSTK